MAIQPSMPPPTPASVDEMLTYECARSVVNYLSSQEVDIGPIFHRDGLVFTSIDLANGTSSLIVSAGSGTFAVPITSGEINRVRFSLPKGSKSEAHTYFMAYVYGLGLTSKTLEFSSGRPPEGRDVLDYSPVAATRAEELLPYLEYAVHEKIKRTVKAVNEKRLAAADIGHLNPFVCEHISRTRPDLGRTIRQNLAFLEKLVMPPKKKTQTASNLKIIRSPASLGNLN